MRNVFDLLDAEWRRLRWDRRAARLLADVRAEAGGARSLEGVERYVRRAGAADSDRVLVRLVTHVVGDGHRPADDLAARVTLQLLLPGTRNLARRWWALGDPDDRAGAAVTAVYRRIRTYPLARRPGRVAANVLLDAAQELRRSVPRLVTTPLADPTLARRAESRAPAEPHPAIELAELLRDAVHDGIVSAADAEVIARSRIAGERVDDLARVRGVRPRTLWDHRQRAERALART